MANIHCMLWTRSFSNSHEMGIVNATPNWTLKLLRFKDSVSVPVLFFPLHKSTLNLRGKPLRAKGRWGRGPFQTELYPATWRPLLPRVRGGVQGAQPGATDSTALASGRQGPLRAPKTLRTVSAGPSALSPIQHPLCSCGFNVAAAPARSPHCRCEGQRPPWHGEGLGRQA